MAIKTNPQQSELEALNHRLQKQVDMLIAALEQKNDELTKLKQEKNEFSNIIWEIKSPLSNIKGLAEIISDPNEIIENEEIIEFAMRIKDCADHIFLLIDEFYFINW